MMYREERYQLENELKDYLSSNIEIIEKYLKARFAHYDFIKIDGVEIDNDEFMCYCYLFEGNCRTISPWLPIPTNFLRYKKLKKIKDEII